jgi:diguanylate cyclase (GGDEF)-like protein/PAS domain S-box-containing protein
MLFSAPVLFILLITLLITSLISRDLYAFEKNNFDAKAVSVQISSVKLAASQKSVIVKAGNLIELSHLDSNISIALTTSHHDAAQPVIYEYRMLDQQNPAFYPLSGNTIHFAQLNPGQLVLELRAKIPDSGLYSQVTTAQLNISYPNGLSPRAYISYALIFLLFLALWQLYRSQQGKQLLQAFKQVKHSEDRLHLALKASNSDAWDWLANDNMMWGKRIVNDLGYPENKLLYHFVEHIDFIHPDDRDKFLHKWQEFLQQGDLSSQFICTYRLKSATGQWLWYKDIGKVVALDAANKPARITGGYTLINQDEQSQDLSFGNAFKSTQDWVLIAHQGSKLVTANPALCEVFGLPHTEFKITATTFGVKPDRLKFYLQLLTTFKQGQHWRSDELVITPKGEERHVVVNITAINKQLNGKLQYNFVITDITSQKLQENQLRYMANYDQLTELPNRSLLLDRVKHALDHANRKESCIALLFIDLDRFKQINDSLGHDYGDLLLQQVAKRFTAVLRLDDTVARLGGDEFVILLESFRSTDHLAHIADKLVSALEPVFMLNNKPVNVGASIGIALYPEDANSADELLRNADLAMYHAKQQGRNRYQFFTQRMNDEAQKRNEQGHQLKQALSEHQFVNSYLPIMQDPIGNIVGAELVVQWQFQGKLIPSEQFMPFAKTLGLSTAITEQAMTRALADLQLWQNQCPDFSLSVNLYADHLGKKTLLSDISNLLAMHKINAHSLKLELCETVLLDSQQEVNGILSGLVDIGVAPILDNFGNGQLSLSFITQLPLQGIKVSPSFTAGIGTNINDEACVDATLALANKMAIPAIAQGVTTLAQQHYLRALQCHLWQADRNQCISAAKIQTLLFTAE